MNLAWYDDWKDTDAPYIATVFLDCVAEEFIQSAQHIKGLEKAVRFTQKGRSLGLGACGFHTYTQQKGWAFEGFDTHLWNIEAFKNISEKALAASQWMATVMGEPEWCKGYGTRNTHNMAIAPTKSTAAIMGGVSEGINPDPAMVFTQSTAGGEMDRITPEFLKIMKLKEQYNKKTIKSIVEKNGSVQHLSWLTDEEKLAFRTAFEMDQKAILRLASARQKFIDQGQSLNLFFAANEDEARISEIHQQAFMDENILSLYYIYTLAGVQAAKSECLACM
jgi:ribonucleoside-diphosphate reductase alpha chain